MPPSTSTSAAFPIWYRQPFKSIYVTLRIFGLIALLPYWTAYYSVFQRPRASWTLQESIVVRLIHWLMPLNAMCGLSPLCTDKTRAVPQDELKETTFVWLSPADSSLIRGPAMEGKEVPVRIPGYIWPKGGDLGASGDLVGLFIHGGGYMMGNGTESYMELAIVRELRKISKLKNFLSVDYRLSAEACHPGQLLDALAAYSHLTNTLGIDPAKIVIIGACAGGHLALMLARYIHDEKVLPMPAGIMLFSPWVDMDIDRQIEKDPSVSRPNSNIDMLSTSHLANLRFLGTHPASLLASPLLSANRAPSGSYIGYPRTFISVGECEAFKRECEQLKQAMCTDGIDVLFDEQEDAVHDFFGCGRGVPSDKARTQVANRAAEWIDECNNRLI